MSVLYTLPGLSERRMQKRPMKKPEYQSLSQGSYRTPTTEQEQLLLGQGDG